MIVVAATIFIGLFCCFMVYIVERYENKQLEREKSKKLTDN